VSRTQVGIIGAGPSGLLLAHLLQLRGIESVVLEDRTREYVIARVRAGVLEQGVVDVFRAAGLADRMDVEGLIHHGIELRFSRRGHRIAMSELTGGRTIMIYGQNRVVEDLIKARYDTGGELHYEVEDVSLHDLVSDRPAIRYRHDGRDEVLECDIVAGCDGFHGVSRATIPNDALTAYERVYPFGWLGILAEVAPSTEELIYAYHERGFALHSLRSPTISRLYVQVPADEDVDEWSDDRIWSELHTRLASDDGWSLEEGPVIEKGIAPLRSFVVEPMRYGRLFLAGDAAHIVPPTGAKGLNLAVADVSALAQALAKFFGSGSEAGLDAYSETCLRRVWQGERFSWWMTSMLHRFPDEGPFTEQLQLAQLEHVVTSRAAATALAESYTGLPIPHL
jgi:p-hydroxybenzoate 3-monooxygenase